MGQTRAAPVLADDQHPARPAETLENLRVVGPDRDLVECVHEAVSIDGHAIDVLRQGQPLLESLLRDHQFSSWESPVPVPYHGSLEAHRA